jgi:hypothetical protein
MRDEASMRDGATQPEKRLVTSIRRAGRPVCPRRLRARDEDGWGGVTGVERIDFATRTPSTVTPTGTSPVDSHANRHVPSRQSRRPAPTPSTVTPTGTPPVDSHADLHAPRRQSRRPARPPGSRAERVRVKADRDMPAITPGVTPGVMLESVEE